MKKKIVVGSIVAVVLMMMVPAVTAAEANTVQSAMMQQNLLRIPDIDMELLRERAQDDPSPQTVILLTLLILLMRGGIIFLQFLRAGTILLLTGIIAILIKILRNRQDNMTAFII